MPTPSKGESRKDYISRCVPMVMKDGATSDNKQAVAICHSKYDAHEKKMRGMTAEPVDTVNDRPVYMTVLGAVDTSAIRTCTYFGRPHLIVPVIALLGDTVVRPRNSKGREFVPASALLRAPSSWDGRPIVPFHPNEGRTSANSPSILTAYKFGEIHNTRYEDGRLKLDAYLDLDRAKEVGTLATDVISACQSGKQVEVSVGAWITAVEEHGISPTGAEYDYVWHDPIPDHLAVGLMGQRGACSIEMGCGMPRTLTGAENPDPPLASAGGLMSMLGALRAFFRGTEDSEMSDGDLRRALSDALRAVEPGFDGVHAVYPSESYVIYMANPEKSYLWLRRSYSLDSTGAVTLKDDRTEVHPVTRYEPVVSTSSAAVDPPAPSLAPGSFSTAADVFPASPVVPAAAESSECGCHGHAQESENSMTKSELIAQLVGSEATPFDKTDIPQLESFSDERLTAMVAHCAKLTAAKPAAPEVKPATLAAATVTAELAPTPAPTPSTAVAVATPVTLVDWLATAPPEVRTQVERGIAIENEQRTSLIASLTSGQSAFSAEDLAAKPTEELTKLAAALQIAAPVLDYSGKGMPIVRGAAGAASVLPDTWGLNAKTN